MLTFLCCLMLNFQVAYAAGGKVSFGSTEYNEADNSKFPIGVYISTTERNQDYHIELKYDKYRMQYIKGGNSEDDGIITLEGQGLSSTRKYMLSFETLSGGNGYISVVDGYICNHDGTNKQPIENLNSVNVFIDGEDIVGEIEEEESEVNDTDIDEAQNEKSTVTEIVKEQSGVEEKESENSDVMELKNIVFDTVEATFSSHSLMIELILLIICIVSLIIVTIRFIKGSKRADEIDDFADAQEESMNNSFEIENLDDLDDSETVISVKNVTMKFKVATQNTSGIKDYFIQLLKRKITYREFFALDNVSFDVNKGEVVGIIGTNGSGKSTILKIVSGALRPTSGNIEVDRKKVQLLTLGTGFDMELTGRENVYLNGAIIGYSKAFLDEHYDEIVKFAELEDFMDEKVKNYSSGMVSRLGFAIATAGDAAEILILDEVLSVGDEFFRKKSLARVKEMIHGGSTVLLVSHSMPTIRDNCSKVVWIEKGKLRMVGKPEVVCKAYQHMNEIDANQSAQVSEVS